MSLTIIIIALCLYAASGLPGLLINRHTRTGQYLATGMAVLGSILGLLGSGMILTTGSIWTLQYAWTIPVGSMYLSVDSLSAFFLVSIFVIGGLGSVYGQEYWKQNEHPENGRKLRLFYGLLIAGMGLVVLARDGVLFLIAWELMALSAYFLITTEDDKPEVCEAGWIYLIATHTGTLCLFALFSLLNKVSGLFSLVPLMSAQLSPVLAGVIFVLALVGFGFKAGIMPLHFWLPGAHANAPSHVSATLSGVMIKMGIYGLIRIYSLIPNPPISWGGIILGLGVISSLVGVMYAIGQHDLKRLLAYHSIENIGIILMGLGLAMLGRSMNHPDWIFLGMAGCLLHVWNHGIFKSLLFFSAGSVIHHLETRSIDVMGGVGRKMPVTGLMFFIGSVAICGLPPLNGFISELFIYLGLFSTLTVQNHPSFIFVALVVPALAMTGALAVSCFVKVYGAVFLGEPRTSVIDKAHESKSSMLIPMMMLAGFAFLIGVFPIVVTPVLESVIRQWMPAGQSTSLSLSTLAPLNWITGMALTLAILILVGFYFMKKIVVQRTDREYGTWDCGYLAPTARMQYTASSFAQSLVLLFGWILNPREHKPVIRELFPQSAEHHNHVEDAVLDKTLKPFGEQIEQCFNWFRRFHQGLSQQYILYIIVALILLLILSYGSGASFLNGLFN